MFDFSTYLYIAIVRWDYKALKINQILLILKTRDQKQTYCDKLDLLTQFLNLLCISVYIIRIEKYNQVHRVEYIVRDTMPLMRVYQIQPNTKTTQGSFTNYVDNILAFLDLLPPCVDIFYGMNVDQKQLTFLDHLPTSSCKRSFGL